MVSEVEARLFRYALCLPVIEDKPFNMQSILLKQVSLYHTEKAVSTMHPMAENAYNTQKTALIAYHIGKASACPTGNTDALL